MGVINVTVTESKDDIKPTDHQTVTGDEASVIKEDQQDTKEKHVAIAGPLGHIYTNALNAVYSNEGIDIVANSIEESLTDQVDSTLGDEIKHEINSEGDSVYVYCCDGDKLDTSNTNQVISMLQRAIKSDKYSKVGLAIEHRGTITSRIALLSEFSESIGAKVWMLKSNTRDKLSSSLESYMRVK